MQTLLSKTSKIMSSEQLKQGVAPGSNLHRPRSQSTATLRTDSSPLDHDSDLSLSHQFDSVSSDALQLESYVELLYEDMESKLKGAAKINQLALQPQNIPLLVGNESVLTALARVLSEEGRKSMDLARTILHTFLSISTAQPQYRQLLMQNRIGDTSIKTIEREIARYEIWRDELWGLCRSTQSASSTTTAKLEKLKSLFKKQDDLLLVAIHILLQLSDDVVIEEKLSRRDVVGLLVKVLAIQTSRSSMIRNLPHSLLSQKSVDMRQFEYENMDLVHPVLAFLLQMSVRVENQSRLLAVDESFYHGVVGILEAPNTKVYLLALKLISNLCQSMPLCLKFLAVPTFVKEIGDLAFSQSDQHISSIAFQVLSLVSMCHDGREAIADSTIITTLMKTILECPTTRVPLQKANLACILLVSEHVCEIVCGGANSADPDFGLGLKLLLNRAIKTCDPSVWKIIMTIMNSNNEGIKFVVIEYLDDMMKILHSYHSKYLSTLGTILQGAAKQPKDLEDCYEASSICLSIFSIIGSLNLEDMDFMKLDSTFHILRSVADCLMAFLNLANISSRDLLSINNGMRLQYVAEDIALQAVILLGTMLIDENMPELILGYRAAGKAHTLVDSKSSQRPHSSRGKASDSKRSSETSMIQLLIEVLQTTQQDKRFVKNILYVFYCLLSSEQGSKELSKNRDMLTLLLGYVWDDDAEVREFAEISLMLLEEHYNAIPIPEDAHSPTAILRDFGMELSRSFVERRFQFYNSDWVLATQREISNILDDYGELEARFRKRKSGVDTTALQSNEYVVGGEETGDVELESEGVILLHDGNQILQFAS